MAGRRGGRPSPAHPPGTGLSAPDLAVAGGSPPPAPFVATLLPPVSAVASSLHPRAQTSDPPFPFPLPERPLTRAQTRYSGVC